MVAIHKPAHDVILKPVVSEKSYAASDRGQYTFVVAPDANKVQIKQACLLDLHLVRIRSHHEGVLATVGSGVALLGDDGLKNHVVSGLVNSDHLNQASFGSVLAATKASKASLVKTTYCEVITSYVLS